MWEACGTEVMYGFQRAGGQQQRDSLHGAMTGGSQPLRNAFSAVLEAINDLGVARPLSSERDGTLLLQTWILMSDKGSG